MFTSPPSFVVRPTEAASRLPLPVLSSTAYRLPPTAYCYLTLTVSVFAPQGEAKLTE